MAPNISIMPAGPMGEAGLSALSSLASKTRDPATRREALARACAEVEGVFLSQLLQQMRKTFVAAAGPKQKHADFSQLYEQQVAQALASGGGIGLGRRLFEDLQHRFPLKREEKKNDAPRIESPAGTPAPAGGFPVPGPPGMPGTGGPGPGRGPGGEHPEPDHG